MRKYPVGIQTFAELIREGYIYVDKTDLVWQLAHYAKYIFMSRPRRFGKSLLTSTLHSYFRGQKELFKGLAIEKMERQWTQYPVLHFSLASAKRGTVEDLNAQLRLQLEWAAQDYQVDTPTGDVTVGLQSLVKNLYLKTGKQVAVLIDEYDAPLLTVLHDADRLEPMRTALQSFYAPLKDLDPYLRFVFITGITKFSQLSIFSQLNNLKNVSLLPQFSALCGFTEQEVRTVFAPDIEQMAASFKLTPEAMYAKIKLQYDGYRFAGGGEAVFNPFSLLNALGDKMLSNYWFASGTPTFLIKQMQHFHTDITSLDSLEVPASAFDQPTENMPDALPLLYQSGYLTIKDYDPDIQSYHLSIPNQEVRVGYVNGLLPTYTGLNSADVQMGFAAKFWRALKQGDIDLAMRHMQAYLAGIPYVEGFKRKLAEAATKEGFYEYTFYLIFSMLNVYVRTQVKVAGGRVDMVVFMPDTIYVMELKTGDSAQHALDQIDARGYATPYLTDGRRVVEVGIRFDIDKFTVEEWKIK